MKLELAFGHPRAPLPAPSAIQIVKAVSRMDTRKRNAIEYSGKHICYDESNQTAWLSSSAALPLSLRIQVHRHPSSRPLS